MTYQVGEVDWNTGAVGQRQSDFLSLKEGDNIIRIFSKPYQYWVHILKDATGNTRRVNCCINNCPGEAAGDEAKARWIIKVLLKSNSSRPNGPTQAFILDIGEQIYQGILKLVNMQQWGGLEKSATSFDINVVRGPKGAQPLYSVIPVGKIDFTEQEKDICRKANEKINIQKLIAPSTPDAFAQKLGWTSMPRQPMQQQPYRPAVNATAAPMYAATSGTAVPPPPQQQYVQQAPQQQYVQPAPQYTQPVQQPIQQPASNVSNEFQPAPQPIQGQPKASVDFLDI